ncbi:MAG: TlpA family protein disulfide reductase [Candidatus Aegiribacteria sp.]|nr:TlpA family protein disulfide reductase [Candidatus Aegiribacteria sp.]
MSLWKIITMLVLITSLILTVSSCGEAETEQPAGAQDVDAALENQDFILADSASEALEACSYTFRVYGTGVYADSPAMVGNISGRSLVKEGEMLLFAEIGLDTTPDIEDEIELSLTLASGVDSAYFHDKLDGVFRKGSLEEGGGDLLRHANYAIMYEYFLSDPFADEIVSQSVVFEDKDSIGPEACNTYLVTYSGGQQAKWSLSIADHLPRRVERMIAGQDGSPASIVLEVYNLETAPDLPDSMFILVPPAGIDAEIYSAFLLTGTQAPEWNLSDSDGNMVSLEALRGNVVVIDFWATWCGPCKVVMPEIQSLHEKYADQPVMIYGVNVWESGDAAAFMLENAYTYGLLLESDAVAEEYKVSGIPTLYVIDQEGNIAFAQVGSSSDLGLTLTEVIDGLLAVE